jgi:hypothetical protein
MDAIWVGTGFSIDFTHNLYLHLEGVLVYPLLILGLFNASDKAPNTVGL